MQKTESETFTIRIDSVLLDELKKIADTDKISPNMLISQVMREYLEWHALAIEAGMGYFDKKSIQQLIECISTESMDLLAKHYGENELMEALLVMKKDCTVTSFIKFLESRLKFSGFPHIVEDNERFTKFIINFNMGKKWAKFLEKTYVTLLKQITAQKIETRVIDCTLVLIIYKET